MSQVVQITVGCPGSGKSTHAKALVRVHDAQFAEPKLVYLSSDELRAKFGKSESDQSVTHTVFDHIHKELDNLLEKGYSVIIDATSINKKNRKKYIDIAKKYKVRIEALVFIQPKNILLERINKRINQGGRDVPEWVIDKMLNQFENPTIEEGFTEVYYV